MSGNGSCAEAVQAKRQRRKMEERSRNRGDRDPATPGGAYVLEIDERDGRWKLLHGSERFRHVEQETTTTISAKVGIDEYEFIKIAPDGITLRTWHSGCFPVFYRTFPDGVRLSNHPHLLFRSGETVTVKAQVVAQRISAQARQVYNPFVTIGHLEDSAEYRLRGSGFVPARSYFVRDPHASYERLRDVLLRRFRAYVREDRPIAVPLSGGYDSRLILVCMQAVASNGRARLRGYHEYKSDVERELAVQVAERCRAPISHFGRDDRPEQVQTISRDPEFILSAGLNRPTTPRWSMHIARMREQQGDDVRVIGLNGAEPHKGLYYRQIENLERDTLRVFAPGGSHLQAGLSHLGLERCEDFYTPFLRSILEQSAEVYDCKISRLDFVFYHVHLVNNNGNRFRYYLDRFDNRYPTCDPEFMNLVFSLPRSQKEAALIPKKLIADLNKEVVCLPYISANAHRMTPRPNLYERIVSRVSRTVRPAPPPPIKGRTAKGALVDHQPESVLTAALRAAARSTHPLIGQADAIIAYNYFSTLEQRLGIGFHLV